LVAGGVVDVRAFSIEIQGQCERLVGVEKGELLQDYTTPVMLMSKAQGRSGYMDLAMMGLESRGIDRPGEVAVLRFAGTPRVQLAEADAR
ncbi:MAG TPA: hypothetical protein DGH68_01885, partial [Bacteroidetes bacterium]|nr:hypothetical protein [Bacteroidota bacterium]